MALIDDIKTILRVNGNDLDSEITDLIESVKSDLSLSGVNKDKIIDTDPLIKRAIIIYCKANFGWDNPETERLQNSYNMLKTHLTLSSEYTMITEI